MEAAPSNKRPHPEAETQETEPVTKKDKPGLEKPISLSFMETDDDTSDQLQILIEPKAPAASLISHEERPTYGTPLMSDGKTYARRIELTEFDGFISKMYDHIKDTLCAGFYLEDEFDFTLDHFRLAMRYAQQMRLWTVVRSANPNPPKEAIAYSKEFLIPKAFANLLSNLGSCSLNQNTVFFIPYPAKEAYATSVKVRFDTIRLKYLELVKILESQKVIPLDSLASMTSGTPFWIFNLSRIYATNDAPTIFDDEMKVLSPYADVTPASLRDAVMACRVPRITTYYQQWLASEDPQASTSLDIDFTCESQRYVNVLEDRDCYIRQPY